MFLLSLRSRFNCNFSNSSKIQLTRQLNIIPSTVHNIPYQYCRRINTTATNQWEQPVQEHHNTSAKQTNKIVKSNQQIRLTQHYSTRDKILSATSLDLLRKIIKFDYPPLNHLEIVSSFQQLANIYNNAKAKQRPFETKIAVFIYNKLVTRSFQLLPSSYTNTDQLSDVSQPSASFEFLTLIDSISIVSAISQLEFLDNTDNNTISLLDQLYQLIHAQLRQPTCTIPQHVKLLQAALTHQHCQSTHEIIQYLVPHLLSEPAVSSLTSLQVRSIVLCLRQLSPLLVESFHDHFTPSSTFFRFLKNSIQRSDQPLTPDEITNYLYSARIFLQLRLESQFIQLFCETVIGHITTHHVQHAKPYQIQFWISVCAAVRCRNESLLQECADLIQKRYEQFTPGQCCSFIVNFISLQFPHPVVMTLFNNISAYFSQLSFSSLVELSASICSIQLELTPSGQHYLQLIISILKQRLLNNFNYTRQEAILLHRIQISLQLCLFDGACAVDLLFDDVHAHHWNAIHRQQAAYYNDYLPYRHFRRSIFECFSSLPPHFSFTSNFITSLGYRPHYIDLQNRIILYCESFSQTMRSFPYQPISQIQWKYYHCKREGYKVITIHQQHWFKLTRKERVNMLVNKLNSARQK